MTRILGSRRSGSGDLSDECLETKEANKTLDQEHAVMGSGRTYYSVILARPGMSYNLAMFCTYLRIDFELGRYTHQTSNVDIKRLPSRTIHLRVCGVWMTMLRPANRVCIYRVKASQRRKLFEISMSISSIRFCLSSMLSNLRSHSDASWLPSFSSWLAVSCGSRSCLPLRPCS